ncbi:MAG: hypothetical protein IPL49_07620 [Saprospirales bacterium]|nr:hypothetical protein [Saprospirales bacterium]MBK8490752.1 hypothetical protein [Saprospirales bacterium]
MSIRTLWLPILVLLLFAACLPVKYALDNLPDQQLYFGSGGGFSGASKEYLVLHNGQVYLFELGVHKQDTFELQTIPRPEARKLFMQLDSLRLHKYDFVYPGNMRYYIRETDAQTDHTIQWGDPRWDVRSDVVQFYQELTALMENRKVISDFKEENKKPKDPW